MSDEKQETIFSYPEFAVLGLDYGSFFGGLDFLKGMSDYMLSVYNKRMEEERRRKLERLNGYKIQLSQVAFSDSVRKEYNIDDRYNGSYFTITDKETGKQLCKEMLCCHKQGDSIIKFLEFLNGETENRYMVVQYAMPFKYTKEDRKKYKYLTGNHGYSQCYAIIDRETLSLVWKSTERFGQSPTVRNNVMSLKGEYTYIPEMKQIYKKSYGTTITTKTKIIIEEEYLKTAKLIDTVTGTVTDIE